MTRADPESRLKADTGAWLQRVKASGLILPDQKPLKRSPVECGISIDYLAQLAESIKEHPLLPTTTRLVVENLINAATSEQGCRFIDLIPQEHVGPATAVVCHSWNGDFLDTLTTLVDEFNMRFDAHKAYKSQRKTAAQVLAEEQEAAAAEEEARKLQEKVDMAMAAAKARWSQFEEPDNNKPERTESPLRSSDTGDPWMLSVFQQPPKQPATVLKPGATQSGSPRSPAKPGTQAAAAAAAAARAATAAGDTGPGPVQPAAAPAGSRLILAAMGAKQPDQSGSPRSTQGASPRAEKKPGTASSTNSSPRQTARGPLPGLQAAAAGLGGTDAPASPSKPRFNLGAVVDVVTQRAIETGELKVSPTRTIKDAAKRVLLNRRSMGAETALGIRPAPSHSPEPPPPPPTILARSGTFHQRRTQTQTQVADGEDPSASQTSQSIYKRAQACTDLTRLLRPLDEDQEVLDAFIKAQKAAQEKVAATKAEKEQDTMREEKKKLQGYYVWIDCLALPQFGKDPSHTGDLSAMSRLIHVVGRTLVMVDDDWGVLKRLWCLYEIWMSIKHKATLLTLTAASAQPQPPSPALTRQPRTKPSPTQPAPDTQPQNNPTNSTQDTSQSRPQSQAAGLDMPLVSLAESDASYLADDAWQALQPVPRIALMQAKATLPQDKLAILAVWSEEVQSPRSQVGSLQQVCDLMHRRLSAAREREAQRPSLVRSLYQCLTLCGRNWRDVLPCVADLHAAKEAIKAIAEEHLPREYASAKELRAVSDSDVEMELWQLIVFVAKHLMQQKVEPFWVAELNRFANLAHKSFATRFSTNYVNNLLRAAGTFDDMNVLKAYVYGCCHARIRSNREDEGE